MLSLFLLPEIDKWRHSERGRDVAGKSDSYELIIVCIFRNKGDVAHTRPVPHKVYQSSGCSFNNAISIYALL